MERLGLKQLPVLLLSILLASQSKSAGSVTVLASTSLESCVVSGQEESQASHCSDKIVALVAIDAGTLSTTTQLEFNVSCIGSDARRCPCDCNYISQPNCDCRDLTTTALVRLERSPVHAAFPLTYLRTFNARPYEVRIYMPTDRGGAAY